MPKTGGRHAPVRQEARRAESPKRRMRKRRAKRRAHRAAPRHRKRQRRALRRDRGPRGQPFPVRRAPSFRAPPPARIFGVEGRTANAFRAAALPRCRSYEYAAKPIGTSLSIRNGCLRLAGDGQPAAKDLRQLPSASPFRWCCSDDNDSVTEAQRLLNGSEAPPPGFFQSIHTVHHNHDLRKCRISYRSHQFLSQKMIFWVVYRPPFDHRENGRRRFSAP